MHPVITEAVAAQRARELHADAAADYERRSREEAASLDADARRRILDLAEQLPRIWNDPRVDFRERKRILRLLVDDVTLIKADTITAHVRLSGGATRTLTLERPLPVAKLRKFKPELVAAVDGEDRLQPGLEEAPMAGLRA